MSHEKQKTTHEDYVGLNEVNMDDITRFVEASRLAHDNPKPDIEPVAAEIPAETRELIDAFMARHTGGLSRATREARSREQATQFLVRRNK